MSSRSSPLLYGAYKLLGGRVAEVEPLFGAMACMRNVEREEFANLECLRITFPEARELHAFINYLQRIIQIRGMALFPRTELTDLSAKAQAHPSKQERDVKAYIPDDMLSSQIEASQYLEDGEQY